MFAEARNSKSPGKVKTLSKVMSDTGKSSVVRNLINTQSFSKTDSKRGGKSRRVFRKKTKTTRRRNKKSNRSHRHRRTSHVAKQT